MIPHISALLALLCVYTQSSLAQAFPRQTITLNTTTTSSALPASVTTPPCCWILGGFQAVKVNSWYTTSVVQYTATVITTVLQYRDTLIVANSSTRYLPTNATYTSFGEFGQWGIHAVPSIPGVPGDLIPSSLVTGTTNYAGTSVGRETDTVASFTFTNLQVPSPTPFAYWNPLIVYTSSRDSVATCGTPSALTYATYTNGNWTTTTRTTAVPDSSIMSKLQASGTYPAQAHFQYVQTLPAPPPNDQIWIGVPDDFVGWLASDSQILSASPWITDCVTLTGYGQPTAHVAVSQLTTDTTSVITLDIPFNNPSTLPSTPNLLHAPSSQPNPQPTVQSEVATPLLKSIAVVPALASETPQPLSSISNPQAELPDAGSVPGSLTQVTSPISLPLNPTPSPQTQILTLASDQTLTAIIDPVSPSQIQLGSQILTIPAFSNSEATQILTFGSQAYTASALNPDTIILAGQTTTLTLEVAPLYASPSPSPTTPPSIQTITFGGQTFEISALGAGAGTAAETASGTGTASTTAVPEIVVNGQTFTVGSGSGTLVVNGETLILTGSEIVFASGSVTSTAQLDPGVIASTRTGAGWITTTASTALGAVEAGGVGATTMTMTSTRGSENGGRRAWRMSWWGVGLPLGVGIGLVGL